nr:hypothetical protein [Tanacetum cinerariifolium]
MNRSIWELTFSVQSNTSPDSYSAASHFGGVIDWYQEPRAIRRRITKSGWTIDNVRGSIRICCSCISDPTFTDYVPSPEEPEQAPPSSVYIPYVPEYPKYIPLEDEVFLAEEQPLPATASPTTDSLGYIPESDPDEDLEDDDDEDPEEDPADYPADHDDDDEEEHPASADSIPPPPALRVMARISFRP